MGDTDDRYTLTEIPLQKGFSVKKVIARDHHTIYLGKDDQGHTKVYTCGYNYYGQLCLGDNKNRFTLTELPLPKGFNVEKVIVGDGHTIYLGKDDLGHTKVYGCGDNEHGQLGLGDNINRNTLTDLPIGHLLYPASEAEMHTSSNSFTMSRSSDG